MPLDFPSNPNLNDTYTYSGTTWVFNGTMWSKSSSATTTLNLTTSNVIESANLYFTNARVYANVIGLVNAKANITDLNTSNITEGNNLYFTNARSRSALVAGNGIGIAANGMVTAAVSSTAVTPANVSSQVNTDTGYFGLPSGNTAQRPVSPANGFVRYNTTIGTGEIYNSTVGQWLQFGISPAVNVEYLAVGGGGGAGGGVAGVNYGAGGAAGVARTGISTSIAVNTAYTVTIGGGGAGVFGQATGGNGSSSIFASITATGGNGAGTGFAGANNADYSGAPNGGGGFNAGGGAGAGGNGINTNGGVGVSNSISGSATFYGGGGGGGNTGIGGGGGGGSYKGGNGTTNRGGGGGGADANSTGGTGGSGIVILKYLNTYTATFSAGLTVSTTSANGYKTSTITAGTGTVTFNIS